MTPVDFSNLERIDRASAAVVNRTLRTDYRLITHEVTRALRRWCEDATLSLTTISREPYRRDDGEVFALTHHGVRGSADLFVSDSLSRRLLDTVSGEESQRLDAFDRGFLYVVVADLVDRVKANGFPHLELRPESVSRKIDPLTFAFTATWAGETHAFALTTDVVFWEGVLAMTDLRPGGIGDATTDLVVSLQVALGRLTITRDQFLDLAVGDALFPAHGVTTEQISATDTGHLRVGDRIAPCAVRVDDLRWLCDITGSPHVDKTMEESATAEWAGAEVTIDVVVGETKIPLKELAALVPGYTLELPQTVSTQVSLVSNGEPFARGELVDIEGRLGVRITTVDRRGG